MSSVKPRKRMLGEALLEKGLVNQDQLRIALTEQKKQSLPLGKILIQLGFVTEALMRDALGETTGQESISLANVIADADAVQLIPKEVARRYKLVPLSLDREKNQLTVAMADTFNVIAIDQLNAALGGEIHVKTLLAAEPEIEAAIDNFYGFELSIDGIINEIETGEIDYTSLQTGNNEYSQPLVRLVDALLADAVKRGASYIHFEPEQGFLRVRYRVDGVMRQVRTLHKNYWSGISVRVKVMAGLNIAETRAPQDGRISLTLLGRPIDFRVAAQPTSHGENIVLRVLDRQKGIVPLDKLNLTEDMLALLKLLMARPEGIILVTGPTGSGKTTTLYSMLNHVNSEDVNIMTLEDPVEYPMSMIRQSSVNEATKMDFANGIRSMMRQDPDIILVGEIRDEQTAEMAFRAAMTGHQVYSTLHSNSAIGAIPRLLDIGVKPEVMEGNIIGIVAQRLARRLCLHCKEAYAPSELERQLLGLGDVQYEQVKLYRAKGCERCEQQGYKGRFSLLEILRMDGEIDALLARRASKHELELHAKARGFKTLADDGVRFILNGATSLEEVSRVVDLTARIV
ncbi:MAG: Flp pilus assembly complex ATPase component TadA [Gammaproteobacteria bacterium]|nr:Flp pilus assembly complex ATPase component TadA [Gammaproteobacteria bacterium]